LIIARRFGSAMISNADFMVLIYTSGHMPVKAYKAGYPGMFDSQVGCKEALRDLTGRDCIAKARANSARASIKPLGEGLSSRFPTESRALVVLRQSRQETVCLSIG
jgi:hypothetical protein